MRKTQLPLQSFRLQNFKAVQDSGIIKFTPLTVFIGYNGSGKSSIVEGLETLQSIVVSGLDEAMQQWRGFEHIWNQASVHTLRRPAEGRAYHTNPIRFELRGSSDSGTLHVALEVGLGAGGNELFIQKEYCATKGVAEFKRDASGQVEGMNGKFKGFQADGVPFLSRFMAEDMDIREWQFVSLSPQAMGSPVPQKRTGGPIRLAKDGSNVAEYLLSIRAMDQAAFDGIVETLQFVLPYARDVQPALTSELERTVYLQMTERDFKLPGWLLSTGTLRILAILALLRHPTPPPLIVIEEIENGLDPRTIHLIVDELRRTVESGRSQVVITTHSPYLLDLLTLSQIIVVERDEGGSPIFTRPDVESLREWSTKFGPGRLYTMNRLPGGERE